VGWLLNGIPDDPSQPGWGGQFVHAWKRPYARFDRLTTPDDQMEVFGVLELVLPLGDNASEKPEAQLMVENQTIPGDVSGDGTVRFRFCPKAARTYEFTIRSNLPVLDGKTGGIKSVAPAARVVENPAPSLPNWWTDDPTPEFAEGEHHGAKSVSRWREEFLSDFAKHMLRCKSPTSTEATR
jgi:hypothetical protein